MFFFCWFFVNVVNGDDWCTSWPDWNLFFFTFCCVILDVVFFGVEFLLGVWLYVARWYLVIVSFLRLRFQMWVREKPSMGSSTSSVMVISGRGCDGGASGSSWGSTDVVGTRGSEVSGVVVTKGAGATVC